MQAMLLLFLACPEPSPPVVDDSRTDSPVDSTSDDTGDPPDTEDTDTDDPDDTGDTDTAAPAPWGWSGTHDLEEAAALRLAREDEGAGLGFAMAAGDLDGDGRPELVVSAPLGNLGEPSGGGVHVVSSQLRGSHTLAGGIAGEAPWDYTGQAVAVVPDRNGDGRAELFIGATNHDAGGLDAGAAYLLHGPAGGPLGSAALKITGGGQGHYLGGRVGSLDRGLVVGASGASEGAGAVYVFPLELEGVWSVDRADLSVSGLEPGGGLGISVASADLDGDGVDELLAGGPWEYAAEGSGQVVVVGGEDSGALSTDALHGWRGDEDVHLGNALAAGADIDADGYPDALLAAYRDSTTIEYGGAVYVLGGGSTLPESLDELPRVTGETEYGYLGIRVDLFHADGDEHADLLLGEYGAGTARVVMGPVEGTVEVRFQGEPSTSAGYTVRSAGDVDADGLGDLLVSAWTAPSGGLAFLVLGSGPVE